MRLRQSSANGKNFVRTILLPLLRIIRYTVREDVLLQIDGLLLGLFRCEESGRAQAFHVGLAAHLPPEPPAPVGFRNTLKIEVVAAGVALRLFALPMEFLSTAGGLISRWKEC